MRTPKLVLCAVLLAAGVPLALHAQQAANPSSPRPTRRLRRRRSRYPKVAARPASPPRRCSAQPRHRRRWPLWFDRLLRQGLPGWRHGATRRRSRLAGHAAVAQSQLGSPRAGQPGREARHRSQGARWLAGFAGRRLRRNRARRSMLSGQRQPPGRPRRRHLAHADAGPPSYRSRSAKSCRATSMLAAADKVLG